MRQCVCLRCSRHTVVKLLPTGCPAAAAAGGGAAAAGAGGVQVVRCLAWATWLAL